MSPQIPDQSQWRLERMQVVNWGGFHGYRELGFAAGTTLISGASGSGKSTMLDAWTALMMPSSVAFNGASNDATTGRARSNDQRNVLSYVRGKKDSAMDRNTGVMADQVLRGAKGPTWSAIAATFVLGGGDERRFTALRIYHAPKGIGSSTQVVYRRAALDGSLDLRTLDDLREGAFDPRALRAHAAGLATFDTDAKFSEAITTRLGIGDAAGGGRALRLLARIQAGHQVKSVDALYKQLVLEKPETYKYAESALTHFASLEASHTALVVDGEKQKMLAPIKGMYEQLVAAQSEVDAMDRFGVHADADSPFDLWSADGEARALAGCVEELADRKQRNDDALVAADREVFRTKAARDELVRQRDANGGGELTRLEAAIEHAEATLERVREDRARFDAHVEPLGLDVGSEASLASARSAARTFLDGLDEMRGGLKQQQSDALVARHEAERDIKELRHEEQSLRERESLVPRAHHEARVAIAQACGLSPGDLPFAAELIDVDPEHEEWRTAAEATLGGVGLTLLMDVRRQAGIRQRIDSLHINRRIRFEGVDLDQRSPKPSDPAYISGRLAFKDDSPFVHWVYERVSADAVDHRCVSSPDQLGGYEAKVTRSGQVSRGKRGAHGRNPNERPVLGFSNAARLAEVQADGRDAVKRSEAARILVDETDAKLRSLDVAEVAHRAVMDASWSRIDVESAAAAAKSLEDERDAILARSDELAAVEKALEEADRAADEASDVRSGLRATKKEIAQTKERVSARIDEVNAQRSRLARVGTTLSAEDRADLDARLSEFAGGQVAWDQWSREERRLRTKLRESSRDARARVSDKEAMLTRIFAQFDKSWPDPNRGTGIASYADYQAIYDHIAAHGLYEQREKFARHVAEWSGGDLIALSRSFDESVSDIKERLEPVNVILAALPFGPEGHRLQIRLREAPSEKVMTFRKEMKALASFATAAIDDGAAIDERFARIGKFMRRINDSQDASERDTLLDVRRHIEITASRLDEHGTEVSTYNTLGGKSGGETQELVTFIVGAALRYQLGDETRTLPRFAPVMLDEGFIKADSEFAQRSLGAWRSLGFQLILAVPLDKVTALEKHVDLLVGITKDIKSGHSFIEVLERETVPGEVVKEQSSEAAL